MSVPRPPAHGEARRTGRRAAGSDAQGGDGGQAGAGGEEPSAGADGVARTAGVGENACAVGQEEVRLWR